MKWPWQRHSDPHQFAAAGARRNDLFSEKAVQLFTESLFGIADPDIVLRKLGKSRKDLRTLEFDDEIGAALDTRFAAVTGTPWRIEPYETDAHKFLWNELDAVMRPMLRTLWRAVPYGYSVAEVIYAKRAGRIGIGAVHDKPMEWFRPTRDGALVYLSPDHAQGIPVSTGAAIDTQPLKFLLARNDASWVNPYGEALLSRVYWPWFFRSNGWQFWARFLERFGAPLLVGSGPGSPDDLARMLASAVQSGAIATSAETKVDAIAPGNAGEAFKDFSIAVDKRIQKAILGQTLTTDVGSTGSYAAAKVQDDVRDDRRIADTRMVMAVVQRLVDSLWALNRFPGDPPEFVMQADEGLSLERAERDAKLAQAGARFTPEYFVRAYDFERGEIEVEQAAQAAAKFSAPSEALQFAPRPMKRQSVAGQDDIDAMADDAIAAGVSPVDSDAIREAIEQAGDEDDLMERLGQLAAGLPATEFRTIVERAMFAADVIGYRSLDRG